LKQKEFFPLLIYSPIWRGDTYNQITLKLIFMSKNQPNDARVGYKAPSNLVELIKYEIHLDSKGGIRWI
jgi:hypothetical protein